MKRNALLLAALSLNVLAWTQAPAPLTLSLSPSAQLPFGPVQDGKPLYSLGFGAELDGDIAIPGLKTLVGRVSLGYVGLPIEGLSKQLAIAGLSLGPCLKLEPLPNLGLQLAAGGGYALLVEPKDTIGNPFAEASIRADYAFSPAFSLGLGAAYRMHFNSSNGFDYQGLGLTLGASFSLGNGPVKPKLQIINILVDPIFPVFYKYYDTNSAGSLKIQNGEQGPIKNLRVSFHVPQFMASPKACASVALLNKGEERELPVYALFTDSIIGITEDTKVDAKLAYSYTYLDTEMKGEYDLSLRIYNRNAMTWDDDRRAAAFVSSKDPLVLTFAKTAAGIGRDASQAVNNPFRQAMSIFQALQAYGLRYVTDPTSRFAGTGKSATSVDFLQFPAQTLAYKSGDCDDLSILYAAMLEGTGVPAAFITVPGHILLAYDLGMEVPEAKAALSQFQDLIIRDGRAWMPIEVTLVQSGFLEAWKTGGREWRDADAQGKASFYPVEEAWNTYEAAAFVGGQTSLAQPSAEVESKAFAAEMARFVEAEVKAREPSIQSDIKNTQGRDPKSINRLGVLYARYALYDRALEQFDKAAVLDYAPAMVNLGNLSLLKSDAKGAKAWFEKAYAKDPASVPVLVGLARACQATDDQAGTASYYAKLKSLDPKTAAKYPELASSSGAAGRAAQAGGAPALWNDSE